MANNSIVPFSIPKYLCVASNPMLSGYFLVFKQTNINTVIYLLGYNITGSSVIDLQVHFVKVMPANPNYLIY